MASQMRQGRADR